MRISTVLWALILCCFLGALTVSVSSSQSVVVKQSGLRAVNINTGLEYTAIQAAIDAPETLSGHVIRVYPGVYREHVVVNKSVSLVGQDPPSTVINGFGGTAVSVKSSGVEIRDFSVQNGTFGILVDHADDVKVVDNLVSSGSYGIRLYHSRNAEVVGNRVSEFRFFGVDVDSSGNSMLRDNDMVSNRYNFGVDGSSLSDFLNDIDVSNTVNGKPVRYLINQRDLVVDSSTFEDTGFLGFVNSTNISVEDLCVRDNKQGILFAFVANSSIVGVEAVDNWNGIFVTHSKNVSVSLCATNNNFDYGIKFFNSPHSVAIGNNADNNGWAGIGLFGSPLSTLDRNEVNFNTYNLHIVYTNNSFITRNNASGLAVSKPGSYSIAVYYSHRNLIYRNSFATVLLFIESKSGSRFPPENTWDSGGEGNYWLYYGGWDRDYDGIGDTSFPVGEENVDRFPLMGRFSSFSVLFDDELYEIDVVSNSTISVPRFDPGTGNLSLTATGRNGTLGFCRISVPSALVEGLRNGRPGFVFSDLQPTLRANWTDAGNHYWYFSYVHSANPESVDSWLWFVAIMVSAVLVSVGLLAVGIRRQKRHHDYN